MKEKKIINPKIVDSVNNKDISLVHYIGAIPNILLFQFVTKSILFVAVKILMFFIGKIGEDTGITAITNMDLPYLFRSWQGILILILGFLILCLYTVFDINAMVLICDNVLHRKDQKIIEILTKTCKSFKFMLHPQALLVLLFVVLIAPLTVSFTGVSLTQSFYIPDFITSVIHKNPIFNIPYRAFLIGMAILGFFYVFTFQFMIFRQENISLAMMESKLTIKKHWKNFLKRYSLFVLKFIFLILAVSVVFCFIPLIVFYTDTPSLTNRFFSVFFGLSFIISLEILKLLYVPFRIMELNRIYESYTEEDEGELLPPEHSKHIPFWSLVLVGFTCLALFSALCLNQEVFDYVFPLNVPDQIIAHRAGGSMGYENTLDGLEKAIKKGVYGAEIDIQRTKDGHYIVHHDDTLDRLCNVNATSDELTLEECKKLRVNDTFNLGGEPKPLATIEEFLDSSKGKIHLYVELKGATADSQMVEDIYQMIMERDMVEEVTVISLKYELIYEMEEKHPEISTGFLCFVSLGNVATLKCDQLLLEDEMATDSVIEKAHEANKKVFIWTVNNEDTMTKRLLDDSDGVITDEVEMATRLYKNMNKRNDSDRIYDIIF